MEKAKGRGMPMSGGDWHDDEEDRLPRKPAREGTDAWRPGPHDWSDRLATEPLEQPIRQPLAGENRPVLTVVAGA
ncbi:MAG: hypothetical protein JWN15_183, partial [Firmicutes bacterium]|nr:hypothetical protein [Bacillota bacterium]